MDELAAARARVELVQAWAAAVCKATEDALLGGKEVPGWKVVHGRKGTRKWIDEDQARDCMRALKVKLEDMYKKTLISPAQAEKILSDKKWATLAEQITQADGKPQVVPESDSRDAISRIDSFEDLTSNS